MFFCVVFTFLARIFIDGNLSRLNMVNAHLKEFHAYLPIHNTIREHWRSPSVHIALPWNIHSFRNSCENQCTSTADSILQDETARLASFPPLYTIFHSLTKLNGRSTVWNWARRGHRIRLTTGDGTQPDRAFWIYILVYNICGQCCSGGCFTRGAGDAVNVWAVRETEINTWSFQIFVWG